MVASALFIMDTKGKVIVSRNYRGDIPMTAAERFDLANFHNMYLMWLEQIFIIYSRKRRDGAPARLHRRRNHLRIHQSMLIYHTRASILISFTILVQQSAPFSDNKEKLECRTYFVFPQQANHGSWISSATLVIECAFNRFSKIISVSWRRSRYETTSSLCMNYWTKQWTSDTRRPASPRSSASKNDWYASLRDFE